MMTGLKRGTVKLIPHQEEWDQNAKEMIGILFELLNDSKKFVLSSRKQGIMYGIVECIYVL